jgi:hypothetical protein
MHQGNVTVAFLDVLGFRDKIDRIPLSSLADSYEKAIELAKALNKKFSMSDEARSLFPNHPPGERWCNRQILSDAIVLESLDESAESALKLLLYARSLVQVFLTLGFSIRGGVAFGELYRNPVTGLVLGKALTKAYELESSQDWLGVTIDNSVVEKYPEIFSQQENRKSILSTLFPLYSVPMKKGVKGDCHVINWRFNMVVEEGTKSLLLKAKLNDAKSKYKNTLEFLKWVRDSGEVYIQDGSNNPVELSAFFVGDSEPPFQHGDEY